MLRYQLAKSGPSKEVEDEFQRLRGASIMQYKQFMENMYYIQTE